MSSAFFAIPRTRLGRWSVSLAAAFMIMFLINSLIFMPTSSDAPWRHLVLPFYGILMLLCGLVAGAVGMVAVIRQHERSWLVWLTILPGLFVLVLILGELLFPH